MDSEVLVFGSAYFQHVWRAGGGRGHSGAPGVKAGPPPGWS